MQPADLPEVPLPESHCCSRQQSGVMRARVSNLRQTSIISRETPYDTSDFPPPQQISGGFPSRIDPLGLTRKSLLIC